MRLLDFQGCITIINQIQNNGSMTYLSRISVNFTCLSNLSSSMLAGQEKSNLDLIVNSAIKSEGAALTLVCSKVGSRITSNLIELTVNKPIIK